LKTLKKAAAVGFEESNDAAVTVSPQPGRGITVELTSPVKRQYGDHLTALVEATVKEAGYSDVHVQVRDKGAWDYALKARVAAALDRGGAE
jgi:citrate lyase acyl carrier protein